MVDRTYDDEDEVKAEIKAETGLAYEFECPECNAHNPYDDGFGDGSEIVCYYCGTNFKVKLAEGKMKLKPL
jgi:transcription elongation factor Elf1